MNPYDIKVEELKDSNEIKDEKELLKLKLAATFLQVISKLETEEVLKSTGLHKSDLSRLRALNVSRFTIDRIVGFLDVLGYTTNFKVRPKKAS